MTNKKVISKKSKNDENAPRKKADTTLKESKELLAQAIDYAAIGMCLVSTDGHFIRVNKNLCELFGYTEAELLTKTFQEITHPDDHKIGSDATKAMLSGKKEQVTFEKRYLKKNGPAFYAKVSSTLLKDDLGKPGFFFTQIEDITSRKKVEEAINESQRMLNIVGDIAKIGGWEMDLEKGGEATWTKGTYDIVELDPGEPIPGAAEHVNWYLPEYREMIHKKMHDLMATRKPMSFEALLKTKKGNLKWCHAFCEAVEENGKVVKLRGTFQDITARKQAEEQFKDKSIQLEKQLKKSEDQRIANLVILNDLNTLTGDLKEEISERKKVELALSQAAQEWQSTFDAAQDAIWILDLEHHILQSNKESEKIFHTSREDLMKAFCYQSVHGTNKPIPECPFTRMKKTLKRESMELEIKGRWLQVTVDPILDESGMLTGAVHIVRDITELKQSAQKVEELAKFPAENPNPVLRISKDGIVLYHNKASKPLLEKWDYQEGKPLKKKWFKIVHECLEDGVIKTYDIGIDDRVTTLTLAPIIEQDFVNIYGLDITERKKAEETLDIERRFSQNLIDTAQAVILLLDPNGKIVSFNPYMENLTGYKLDEVKGKDWFTTFLPKCEYDEIRKLFKIALNETSTIGNVNPIMTKGGKEISIEWYDKVLKDRAGNITGLVSVGYDITERIKNENELEKYRKHLEELVDMRTEELQAANKELEAFAYSVSHDLRAPLRAINGFTSILMEDYAQKLDEEGKRIGSLIQNNSRQMGQLIDDLLAFSRLGRASMQVSKIDMKSMVNAIYHEAASPAERKRVRFSIDDLPEINGDPNMFRQMWMNLISNALKFSSKRDKAIISVSCNIEKNRYIFSIKDNGAGFNMKYKNKLFGVFQRLHTEREFPGTGVGLALVQRIILRHKGVIWAEGKLDEGATFYFSLPKK
jgi:PAS domain S-box-containing protein